ncbi:MAG: T9SS C-terminal target domain-containing protein [Bacteroidetes bacterium]|nr:MAG: T9SS C-terminal target domain-containing protein [Bacteroidota bacterium]
MKKLLLLLTCLFSVSFIFAQTVIVDHEDAATTTNFQYFGSTLEGSLNNIVDNPDPSGINTSAKVGDFVKPADAQTWAGGFSNPNPSVMVDMITHTQICIKVWFNEPGNLALKLENSTTGGPNWITQKEVTQTQTWVELCYDAQEPSIEDPFLPSAGNVYETVVLFFDFGDSPTADRTYYFDDIVTTGMAASEGDITFSVDMNGYTDPFTTVYVSGTFNTWSGDANPLEDPDGDGIWTGTITGIPVGPHEFKFTLDNWAAQEQFTGGETCVVTDPSGQFINRRLVVAGNGDYGPVCFNSCFACGEAVRITFNVGATHITVSPDGLFLAGGGNFGIPGDFPLSDPDGDGVHSLVVERQKGFSSHYTFTNGACGDFSCKEDISGQDCADPASFNDRFLPPVTQDTTINTCFGICTTDTNCGSLGDPGDVTFQVDMSGYTEPFTTVYVSGTMNNWSGDGFPLDDSDGNGVWEGTMNLAAGKYEYKFTLDNWTVQEEFAGGEPCTVVDPSGQFINRLLEVDGDQTLCYIWNTCTTCDTKTRDLEVDQTLFSVYPTLVENTTLVTFRADIPGSKVLKVYTQTGQILNEMNIEPQTTELELNTKAWNAGLYLIYVQTDDKIATHKIVKP